MILNVILLLIGAAFLVYGIKNKTKFFIIAGAVLICFGLVSAGMDYVMDGAGGVDTHRLPFMIDGMMR